MYIVFKLMFRSKIIVRNWSRSKGASWSEKSQTTLILTWSGMIWIFLISSTGICGVGLCVSDREQTHWWRWWHDFYLGTHLFGFDCSRRRTGRPFVASSKYGLENRFGFRVSNFDCSSWLEVGSIQLTVLLFRISRPVFTFVWRSSDVWIDSAPAGSVPQ